MNQSTTPIIFIAAVLISVVILYIILAIRLFRNSKTTPKQNQEDVRTGLFPHLMSSPFCLVQSRCVPVQPRTYEDLGRVYVHHSVFFDQSEEKLGDEGNLMCVPEKHAGKLKFSLQYDTIRSTLSVKLHKAQGLPRPENGDVTYYVTMKIMPEQHRSFQSRAVMGTDPEFKELFKFYVPYEKLQHQSLKFTVSFFDRFSRHEAVGELMVYLAELEKRGLNLAREVLLVRYIHAAQKATGALGEVMLSLGYLRLTERLTVVIIRSRDLRSVEEDQQPPDPYVEVILYHAGRKLKEKKTSIIKKNHNPIFNEALTFHIPIGILHQTSLLLSVMHDDEGRGRDKLIGQVFLGPESTGRQFEHWNEMRVSNKPIARWHKLLE